ncbi:hypothetical protein [Microbacterium sp. B19]|uniref:hypothetical protein n=1 Tax=Microbacterium sp. B19 TaxID=96765 RepID=UPI0003499FAE|nr:hypothetical protein [Microbacterium sp. B19]
MNRRQKIALAVSGVVVAGLVALALPAFGTLGTVASGVHTTAQSFTPAPSFTPTPAASPEVAQTVREPLADRAHRAPLYCDTSYAPPAGTTPYDQGPRAGATGEVEVVDGVPTFYTVAPDDNIVAIGGRFCLDYATIPGMSDIDQRRDIWPGDVLTLVP